VKILPKKHSLTIQIGFIVTLMVLGLLYIYYIWHKVNRNLEETAIRQAQSISAMLSIEEIKTLNADLTDQEKVSYHFLKRKMHEVLEVNPEATFAYLYTLRNGKVFFLMDSEDEGSENYSPPGQEFTEADQEDISPFYTGRPVLTSPLTDRWGTWRSALIPLKDSTTGKVIAVYGMDYNAGNWRKKALVTLFEHTLIVVLFIVTLVLLVIIQNKNLIRKKEIEYRKKLEIELKKNNEDLSNLVAKNEESEEKLKEAQKTAHLGHWNWDILKEELTWSDEIFNIFGVSKETFSVSIENFERTIHPDDLEYFLKTRDEGLKNSLEINIVHRIVLPNGEIRFVEERSKVIRNKDNEPVSVFGTVQDITGIMLVELELKKAKEKAEEANQLKTAFLQNLSHEVRSPLNAIIGFAELINNQKLSKDKIKHYSEIIAGSSNQLLGVINDVLTISSLEKKQTEVDDVVFDLTQFVWEIHSIFQSRVEAKGLTFSIVTNGFGNVKIISDVNKIRQVIANLINNSVKFTQKGDITVGFNLHEHSLEIFVKDTGIGIEKNDQEKIFERFCQANESISRNFGGTGLGLSISKGFIELLGGTISLESVPGLGSTFGFSIPVKKVGSVEESGQIVFSDIDFTSIVNILVAEDEEVNFFYLSEVNDNKNISLIHAINGEEAVNICKTQKIDLVLMDIKMPVLDGYSAAKIIKSQLPNIPVIGLSAFSINSDKIEEESPFDDYLTKPVNLGLLKKTIKKYLIDKTLI